MVETIDAEFARTGSLSTGVFQMLFAGRTGHEPIICCACAGAAVINPATSKNDTELAARRAAVVQNIHDS
jgi:hypothetical protein